MTILAVMTRDLDLESDSFSLTMEYHLASLYAEFSSTLSSLIHNLIANGFLSDKLKDSLLSHLGVAPVVKEGQGNHWPLK